MKYILIFIQALMIAIYHFFFGDPVIATAKVPDNITPGSSFVIEVTIAKPSVTGFAKLQLEIPAAFVATEVESKNGSFSTSGTFVKVIWTSVPSDAELVIKINIAIPASSAGDKQIKGKFSYIAENVKQEALIEPITIKLGGTEAASEVATTTATENDVANQPAKEPETNTQTNTSDGAQSFSKPNEPNATVSVSRKITALGSPDEYQVDLTITKGNVKGFAKLAENIPAGYKADYINESGSVFAFENREARFIWTSIPSSEEIKVSYKLTPDSGASIQKPAYIDGSKFSYIENNQTNTVAIDKQEITEGEQTTIARATTPNTNSNSTTNVTTNTQPENTNTNTQPDNTTTSTQPTNKNETTTTIATTPKSGNVHYSVQIGAFQKSVNSSALGRRYSIKETVRTEMHDGYTKCIIGKFNEYKIARDNREAVKSKGVSDAFVTAYNSGKRITVQEALMVSNQRWYR
ncbi:MAG: hypothetical protein ACYDCN_10440 [Bacteroidia bacterium]